MSAQEPPGGEGRALGRPAPWLRLPPWLRPRERELPGLGRARLIETTLLLLGALLLAIAVGNDLAREVRVNKRLIADERTWRSYTGHDYPNLGTEQNVFGEGVARDVVCGNTSPGAPGARTQLCLALGGPVLDGRREVLGGWYLPGEGEDRRAERYGCFGAAVREVCPR